MNPMRRTVRLSWRESPSNDGRVNNPRTHLKQWALTVVSGDFVDFAFRSHHSTRTKAPRFAAMPPDVRWWLCPTGQDAPHCSWAVPLLLGRSPNRIRSSRKGTALPHIGRHSRARVSTRSLPRGGTDLVPKLTHYLLTHYSTGVRLRFLKNSTYYLSSHCRSGEIGIRTRLKIWRGQTHVGSSPTSGTIHIHPPIRSSIFSHRRSWIVLENEHGRVAIPPVSPHA